MWLDMIHRWYLYRNQFQKSFDELQLFTNPNLIENIVDLWFLIDFEPKICFSPEIPLLRVVSILFSYSVPSNYMNLKKKFHALYVQTKQIPYQQLNMIVRSVIFMDGNSSPKYVKQYYQSNQSGNHFQTVEFTSILLLPTI